MTDSQKLDLILSEVIGMKGDVAVLKEDMAVLKEDVAVLKEKVSVLEQRVTGIEVHLENQTDKNIQLIAENFIELTNKLNQAIPVADKNLAYEVKVNYLIEKVQFLEKDFQEFKYQMAYS